MIYISTGGISNKPAFQTSKILLDFGVKNIELSGGSYDPNNLIELKKLKNMINFKVHNYFPPPENPFVFNLASNDLDIAKMSEDHAKKAMRWSVELNCNSYSFHAGFLLDPKVEELGRKVEKRKLINRDEGLKLFLDRVNRLSDYAISLGVELMIENNVLSLKNSKNFEENPFLMADINETKYIMNNTSSNVNLLIDFAHLKVSSKSIGFDPITFLDEINAYIRAYHFSDNDGKSDSNQSFNNQSWFWDYMKKDLDYYSIEVYDYSKNIMIPLINMLKNKLSL